MKLTTVATPEQLETALKSELVIVDFFAEWCGPCKVISPFVEALQAEYPQVLFVKVDVDQATTVASKHKVSSMPTFVYFHKGKEVNRVIGADRSAITTGLDQLVALNPNAVRLDAESSASAGASDADSTTIASFVPRNMEVLNSGINFTSTEALNIGNNGDVRDVLGAGVESGKEFVSDLDSQILLNIQLQNNSKIHSVLVKKPKLPDDGQIPSHIKVWANQPNLSFDDTSSIDAQHDSPITFDNEWAEIKLRYVRFQNVSTISLLIEGDDEDECTHLARIVLVGTSGEPRSGKLEKIED